MGVNSGAPPPQQRHDRTHRGKRWRGGGDDGAVHDFVVSVIDQQDNVDVHVVFVIINLLKRCRRRRLVKVDVGIEM